MDFQKPIHIHFIGIGGISMSGLAEILLKENFKVSGSDRDESELLSELRALGADVKTPQSASNITPDIDCVCYTAAIHADNPEFIAAKDAGLPMLTRAELLGQIMDHYKSSIAVAGTHGKTTTTSMVTSVLLAAEKDPTVSVGGILSSIGGNIRVGTGDYFVAEACEYTNSYHSLSPRYAIITTIEEDHMDFFHDIGEIRDSFHTFAGKTKEDGTVIISGEIDRYDEIVRDLPCKAVSYGISGDYDYRAEDIGFDEKGCASYTAHFPDGRSFRVELSVPGEHNVWNSLAVCALSGELGIEPDIIRKGLKGFTGANRRFEYKGEIKGITVIDDYAHHPTEIRSTIAAARKLSGKRLVVVFQPHTYTRTKAFFDDFVDALSGADLVVLTEIFAAREKNEIGISAKDLVEKIRETGTECCYFPSFSGAEKFLLKKCINNDLLITMGAGDIYKVGDHLLGK